MGSTFLDSLVQLYGNISNYIMSYNLSEDRITFRRTINGYSESDEDTQPQKNTVGCCTKDFFSSNDRDCHEVTALCPSKLSKRELEELYFDLIERNIDLKKKVNSQEEQLKHMSTRLQRMMATQKPYSAGKMAECGKNCCKGYKAVIDEQRNVIQEIQENNEKLTERIKQLNMQLDSTKQFLKKAPPPGGGPKKAAPRGGPGRPQSAVPSRADSNTRSVSSKSKGPSPKAPMSPRPQPRLPGISETPTKEERSQESKRPGTPTKGGRSGTPTKEPRSNAPSTERQRTTTPTREPRSGTPKGARSGTPTKDSGPNTRTTREDTLATPTRDNGSGIPSKDTRTGTPKSERRNSTSNNMKASPKMMPTSKSVTSPAPAKSTGRPGAPTKDQRQRGLEEWKKIPESKSVTPIASRGAPYESSSTLSSRKSSPETTPYTTPYTTDYKSTDNKSTDKSVDCKCLENNKVDNCQCLEKMLVLDSKLPAMCDANWCAVLMEELKNTIFSLQQELKQTHQEYSTRITRLELEVVDVHADTARVNVAQAAALRELENHARQTAVALRGEQRNAGDLAALLAIEKSRVAELETQLKAASITRQANRTMEQIKAEAAAARADLPTDIVRVTDAVRAADAAKLTDAARAAAVPLATDAAKFTEDARATAVARITDAAKFTDDARATPLARIADAALTDDARATPVARIADAAKFTDDARATAVARINDAARTTGDAAKVTESAKPSKKVRNDVECICFRNYKEFEKWQGSSADSEYQSPVNQEYQPSKESGQKRQERQYPVPGGDDLGYPVIEPANAADDSESTTAEEKEQRSADACCSFPEYQERKVADQDSGFTDPSKTTDSEEEKANALLRQDLIRQIMELQEQLANLKKSASNRTQETSMGDTPLQRDFSRSEETYNVDLMDPEDFRRRKGERADPKEPAARDRSKDLDGANRRWVRYDLDNNEGPLADSTLNSKADPPSSDEKEYFSEKKRPSTTSYESIKYQIPGPIPSSAEGVRKPNPPSRRLSTASTPEEIRRSDESNKYQIPGPIPTSYSEGGHGRKHSPPVAKIPSASKPEEIRPSGSSESRETAPHFTSRRDRVQPGRQFMATPSFEHRESFQMGVDIGKITDAASSSKSPDVQDIKDTMQKIRYAQPKETDYGFYKETEVKPSQAASSFKGPEPLPMYKAAESKGPKGDVFFSPCGLCVPPSSTPRLADPGVRSNFIGSPDSAPERLELCAQGVRVCRCPRAPRRDVAVFRSCSGTLCFTTTNTAASNFRMCQCPPGGTPDIQPSAGTRAPAPTPHISTEDASDSSNSERSAKSTGTLQSRRLSVGPEYSARRPRRVSRSDRVDTNMRRMSPDLDIRPITQSGPTSPDLTMRRMSQADPAFPGQNMRWMPQTQSYPTTAPELNMHRMPQTYPDPNMRRVPQVDRTTQDLNVRRICVPGCGPPGPIVRRDSACSFDDRDPRYSPDEMRRAWARPAQRPDERNQSTSPTRSESPAPFNSAPTPNALRLKTFTVSGAAEVVKCARATSPAGHYDTDREISSMTDLPSEKDQRWLPRSPGEDKATTTTSYTDSGTTPHHLTYSEGEIPRDRPARFTSYMDPYGQDCSPDGERDKLPVTSAQKMELALQAIGEELALCRQLLLQTRRTPEAKRELRDAAASADVERYPGAGAGIALHKARPTTRLSNTVAPRCMFTLHIGTLVLSDEAVMASRDMSLTMMWQFYDQNVAMTRMRAGRVMHFDFSTEYDVKLNEEFLDYLKYEEMPIKICEMSKQDQPFAVCSLPLRDALLHTNRRADISLALLAGPRMRLTREASDRDALDSGDEVGVLDLWCMLRAEPRLLPRINRAIARVGDADGRMPPYSPGALPPIADEDQDEENLSTDMDLVSMPNTRPAATGAHVRDHTTSPERARYRKQSVVSTDTVERRFFSPNEHGIREDDRDSTSQGGGASQGSRRIDPNPPGSNRVDQATYNSDRSQRNFDDKWGTGSDRTLSPGFIINEVPTSIRSTNEMKKVLEKGLKETHVSAKPQIGDDKSFGRIPKEKQKMSLTPLKSGITPSMYETPDSGLKETYDEYQRGEANPGVGARPGPGGSLARDPVGSDSTLLSRKYDNVGNLLILGRKDPKEAYKRVKIDNNSNQQLSSNPNGAPSDAQIDNIDRVRSKTLDITVLWLALNEECQAMADPSVQRLYVAYTFLGRSGADLETPASLPKPRQFVDKCYFNFKKTFQLSDGDLVALGRLARCRKPSKGRPSARECAIFAVVSEPQEDPLGLNNCEDIGYAYLYFGDLVAYSAGGDSYVEVLPVLAAGQAAVCGVLAVKVDGLNLVRKCLMLSNMDHNMERGSF